MNEQETNKKIAEIIGLVSYWFILFGLASFIVMFTWNSVLTKSFQISEIKFYQAMLILFSFRSISLCFDNNK